ncbi:response regulator [Kamptonema cortianum]|nr:response regulator [Geitlerinema splendidum]MDK3156075.1 response regulator [Kamptonema cortianum]
MSDSKRIILLVEDNQDDQRLVRRILEKNNVTNEVVVAGTGDDALAYLEDNTSPSPDLILLDLNLPDIAGLEVLKKIRASKVYGHVPVVILTGDSMAGNLTESYAAGANSYVVKPGTPQEFTEVMLTVSMYWLLVNSPPEKARVASFV